MLYMQMLHSILFLVFFSFS
uniref:Uncharacterized protein n=1 Tax=Rhizophora mucronata TaxID=61149 RepID=A0A2P2QY76_RHIMU